MYHEKGEVDLVVHLLKQLVGHTQRAQEHNFGILFCANLKRTETDLMNNCFQI